MPFVSNAQRKRMFKNEPEMAKERASKTPKGKKLPEHVKKKGRKNNTRLIIWTTILALIVMIRGVMLFSKEMDWTEATAYSSILLIATGIYELVLILRKRSNVYKIAFGIGLGAMFILGLANGAVGIIGNEDNPANLMYRAVFAVGLIGSLIARLEPFRMSYTMFGVAAVQVLVPLFALFVRPAQASWGEAGVIGVLSINVIFAMIFITSALLFRSTSKANK